MKIIAIIPARGNSKSIYKKNLIKFSGKPLIYWTIKQALNTKKIDEVFVSSDSKEILDISKSFGAKTILRPKKYSTDVASSESVLLHALKKINYNPDIVVFLQATSPLRKKNDITNAINKFLKEDPDTLFSGSYLEDFNIWIQNDFTLKSLNYNYKKRTIRQNKNEKLWCENGSFYIFKSNYLKKNKNRLGGKISIYPMKIYQAFEIDERKDVKFLELIFKHMIKK